MSHLAVLLVYISALVTNVLGYNQFGIESITFGRPGGLGGVAPRPYEPGWGPEPRFPGPCMIAPHYGFMCHFLGYSDPAPSVLTRSALDATVCTFRLAHHYPWITDLKRRLKVLARWTVVLVHSNGREAWLHALVASIYENLHYLSNQAESTKERLGHAWAPTCLVDVGWFEAECARMNMSVGSFAQGNNGYDSPFRESGLVSSHMYHSEWKRQIENNTEVIGGNSPAWSDTVLIRIRFSVEPKPDWAMSRWIDSLAMRCVLTGISHKLLDSVFSSAKAAYRVLGVLSERLHEVYWDHLYQELLELVFVAVEIRKCPKTILGVVDTIQRIYKGLVELVFVDNPQVLRVSETREICASFHHKASVLARRMDQTRAAGWSIHEGPIIGYDCRGWTGGEVVGNPGCTPKRGHHSCDAVAPHFSQFFMDEFRERYGTSGYIPDLVSGVNDGSWIFQVGSRAPGGGSGSSGHNE